MSNHVELSYRRQLRAPDLNRFWTNCCLVQNVCHNNVNISGQRAPPKPVFPCVGYNCIRFLGLQFRRGCRHHYCYRTKYKYCERRRSLFSSTFDFAMTIYASLCGQSDRNVKCFSLACVRATDLNWVAPCVLLRRNARSRIGLSVRVCERR